MPFLGSKLSFELECQLPLRLVLDVYWKWLSCSLAGNFQPRCGTFLHSPVGSSPASFCACDLLLYLWRHPCVCVHKAPCVWVVVSGERQSSPFDERVLCKWQKLPLCIRNSGVKVISPVSFSLFLLATSSYLWNTEWWIFRIVLCS